MSQLKPYICPVMIGRDRELAAGTRLLAEVAAGTGMLLLVSGEAGIGKSRLARTLAGIARDRGYRVLEGACYERDRDLPFAPFIDCFRQQSQGGHGGEIRSLLRDGADALAPILPELRPAAPAVPRLSAEEEKRRLFEVFVSLFAQVSKDRPLLLHLEDLHWADETSLELLQLLPRRLAAAPVLVVTTARSDEPGSPLDHWLAVMERQRLLARIELSPLSGPEVARMIKATVVAPAQTAVVVAI